MMLARRLATSSSTASAKTVVELFYDIISPYSYVQFELLSRQKPQWNSMSVRYTPASLGGVLRNADNPAPIQVPAKVVNLHNDMKRLCEFHKIPYAMYPGFPEFASKMGSLKLQRFLAAIESQLDEHTYESLIRAFYVNFFSPSNSLDISQLDVIRQIAASVNIDAALIDKSIEAIGANEIKAKLIENSKRVTDLGGFGLPTTVIHSSNGPQMVFGSDRIHIIGFLLGESKPAILN